MKLSEYDRELLSGGQGRAKQIAMEIVCRMGELYHAPELISITRAHIDGCSYTAVWDAGLEFAEMLAEAGGKVAVPTSLNIGSCDGFNGKAFGNPDDFTEKCRRMERAYYRMGCIPSWTCASYQYCNIPAFGEHVAFAESNVVNFCNSVLGARTERNGDLLDICCALTGRVPAMGLHLTENRYGTMVFDVSELRSDRLNDPSGFAALGYLVGAEGVQRCLRRVRFGGPVSCDRNNAGGAGSPDRAGGTCGERDRTGNGSDAGRSLSAAFQ